MTERFREDQGPAEVGVGPWSGPWPDDPRLDPALLADGDRRNVVDRYRYWRLEDVVADLPGNVRRILEFCGLPFESTCVEFHKTERSVRTASSEQVRQPIFREGLDQWRNYTSWLGPLKEALGDAS